MPEELLALFEHAARLAVCHICRLVPPPPYHFRQDDTKWRPAADRLNLAGSKPRVYMPYSSNIRGGHPIIGSRANMCTVFRNRPNEKRHLFRCAAIHEE